MQVPVDNDVFQFAKLIAAEAANLTLDWFQSHDLKVDIKSDNTEVTDADKAVEEYLRAAIGKEFPDDTIIGEESENFSGKTSRQWIIDPIDGTKSFVRGYPFFSTQIALLHHGELLVGVSSAPCFDGGQVVWAEQGQGAWLNGAPIQVSDVDSLARSTLSIGNVPTLAASSRWASLGQLIQQVHRIRGYGDFYHYHLLASGKLDVVIESDVNILDIAALTVILREAGGDITDLDGGPIDLDTTSVLATNGRLRASAVAVLGDG